MTQKEMIVRHLTDYGHITSYEAFTEYGITRLAARIHDLRADGYKICGAVQYARNRYGKKVKFERYSLEG